MQRSLAPAGGAAERADGGRGTGVAMGPGAGAGQARAEAAGGGAGGWAGVSGAGWGKAGGLELVLTEGVPAASAGFGRWSSRGGAAPSSPTMGGLRLRLALGRGAHLPGGVLARKGGRLTIVLVFSKC